MLGALTLAYNIPHICHGMLCIMHTIKHHWDGLPPHTCCKAPGLNGNPWSPILKQEKSRNNFRKEFPKFRWRSSAAFSTASKSMLAVSFPANASDNDHKSSEVCSKICFGVASAFLAMHQVPSMCFLFESTETKLSPSKQCSEEMSSAAICRNITEAHASAASSRRICSSNSRASQTLPSCIQRSSSLPHFRNANAHQLTNSSMIVS